jgi:hypothetical protein
MMNDQSNESLEKSSSQDLSKRYDSSHIQIIEQYLAQGGEGIELSDFQKKILERLRFADEMIRQNQGRLKRNEIANKIMLHFDINNQTAFKDIVNAEHVFASSYPLNKKYEIGCRIEFLKDQIREASAKSDFDAVARMEKVLQSYLDIYPDQIPSRAKRNIILNVIQNNLSTADNNNGQEMSIEEAIIISEKENEHDQ